MAFKLSLEEKRLILGMRRIEAQDDKRYSDLMVDLRNSLNSAADSLRNLENYMISNPELKKALEKDFDRVEKFIFDSKNLIKKMDKLKVIVKKANSMILSAATKEEALDAAQASCLEVISIFDQDDNNVILSPKADLQSHLIDYGDKKLNAIFDEADSFLNEAKKAFIKLESAIETRI